MSWGFGFIGKVVTFPATAVYNLFSGNDASLAIANGISSEQPSTDLIPVHHSHQPELDSGKKIRLVVISGLFERNYSPRSGNPPQPVVPSGVWTQDASAICDNDDDTWVVVDGENDELSHESDLALSILPKEGQSQSDDNTEDWALMPKTVLDDYLQRTNQQIDKERQRAEEAGQLLKLTEDRCQEVEQQVKQEEEKRLEAERKQEEMESQIAEERSKAEAIQRQLEQAQSVMKNLLDAAGQGDLLQKMMQDGMVALPPELVKALQQAHKKEAASSFIPPPPPPPPLSFYDTSPKTWKNNRLTELTEEQTKKIEKAKAMATAGRTGQAVQNRFSLQDVLLGLNGLKKTGVFNTNLKGSVEVNPHLLNQRTSSLQKPSLWEVRSSQKSLNKIGVSAVEERVLVQRQQILTKETTEQKEARIKQEATDALAANMLKIRKNYNDVISDEDDEDYWT